MAFSADLWLKTTLPYQICGSSQAADWIFKRGNEPQTPCRRHRYTLSGKRLADSLALNGKANCGKSARELPRRKGSRFKLCRQFGGIPPKLGPVFMLINVAHRKSPHLLRTLYHVISARRNDLFLKMGSGDLSPRFKTGLSAPPMRSSSLVTIPPADPYHTPIRDSLSTPHTAYVW